MIQPDRVGGQSCAFRGPVSGIDHAEQQGSGFLIQAVQRMLGQQFLTNPFCTEWWTSPLLTFPEGQFPERQRNPEPLHPVHRFQDITEMDQILVCGIGRNRACLDPFEPVLPEIQHVIACDGCNRLVADDGHEIAHCLDTGISPAPDLVLTLTDYLFPGQGPIKAERCFKRRLRLLDTSQQRGSLDRIRHVAPTLYGFDTLNQFF
nr:MULTISPECIES: hypothetical protein [unclassified Hyphomonas]